MTVSGHARCWWTSTDRVETLNSGTGHWMLDLLVPRKSNALVLVHHNSLLRSQNDVWLGLTLELHISITQHHFVPIPMHHYSGTKNDRLAQGRGAREPVAPVAGYRHKTVLCSRIPWVLDYVTVYIVTPFRPVRRYFKTRALQWVQSSGLPQN